MNKAQARQWSRAAWGLAALFASLPVAGKLITGVWGFQGAAELCFLSLALGTYLHFVGGGRLRALADDAALLEKALQLASEGRAADAIGLLTKVIRRSPRLWQAYQYRGQLYLRERESWEAALADFSAAIELAPDEPHLRELRAQVEALQKGTA